MIPGKSAGAKGFQAYFLAGIHQWNINRRNQLLNVSGSKSYCYNEELMNLVDAQRNHLQEPALFPYHEVAPKATGKYICQINLLLKKSEWTI